MILDHVVTPFVQQAGAARWVLQATVLAFALGELLTALRRRRGAQQVNLSAEVGFRLMLFGAIALLAAARSLIPAAVIPGGVVVFAAAGVGSWLGLLLRWWSVVTLGRYFTTVLAVGDDQPVIESGPYRWVRHPSYSGLLLAFTGCAVMVGNWAGVLGSVVVVVAALLIRIRVEERGLIAALGQRYLGYAAGRARLVPFVW